MKKLIIAAALALLLSMTVSTQAQDEPNKLTDTLSSYIDALKDVVAAFEAVALPACEQLDSGNLRAENLDDAVSNGTVYCRELARNGEFLFNPGAIGRQSVVERGVQQAYDVFGMTDAGVAVQRFEHPILVCLEGRGDLLFLPVFVAPRPVQEPQSFTSDTFTCARVGSPGILALVSN